MKKNINKDKNLYAVILAGGRGTRFWPESRDSNPKQFLNITGNGSLLEGTIARIKGKIPGSNILIVTGSKYKNIVAEQTKKFRIPSSNILLEPCGKNTAPAICWAAAHIYKQNKNAVMLVLPSDHLIQKKNAFIKIINAAVKQAEEGNLVTLGIVPTRPETGYGYLKINKKGNKTKSAFKLDRFVEKPSLSKAKRFLKEKIYLWNSGMFVWRCDVVLEEYRKHLPKTYVLLKEKLGSAYIKKIWDNIQSISVDYGILEKAGNVVAVPAKEIGWSDLGSWESLSEFVKGDKKGNVLQGDVLQFDCKGVFVRGSKRVVATIGLEDVVVIDTEDALLVCKKDMSQKVKDVVAALKKIRKSHV